MNSKFYGKPITELNRYETWMARHLMQLDAEKGKKKLIEQLQYLKKFEKAKAA